MELKCLNMALRLLGCFTADRPLIGVRELSAELGIATSAVHRIVTTFQASGFLSQCSDTRKYRLGIRLWELGVQFREQFKLGETLQALLDAVAVKTGETVYVTFLDGTEAVCVQLSESRESIKLSISLGERTALYAGSRGRVMLAYLTPDTRADVRALLEQSREEGNRTLVAEDALQSIRHDGYCVSHGERISGVVGLSLPIFVRGQVTASVTLGGPDGRLLGTTILKHLPEMRALASAIQSHMQHFG